MLSFEDEEECKVAEYIYDLIFNIFSSEKFITYNSLHNLNKLLKQIFFCGYKPETIQLIWYPSSKHPPTCLTLWSIWLKISSTTKFSL